MKIIVRFFSIILVFFLSLARAHADDIACLKPPSDNNNEDIFVAACVSGCTSLLKSSSVSYFEQNCRRRWQDKNREKTWEENLTGAVEILNRSLVRCPVNATVKVAQDTWDLATALPGIVGGLLGAAWNVVTGQVQSQMQVCAQSPECRRAMARNTVRFQATNADGSWKVTDAEVDRLIATTSMEDLHREAVRDRKAVEDSCRDKASAIKFAVRPGGEAWTPEQITEVYDRLQAQDPRCPQVLRYVRPTPPRSREECLKTSDHPVVECLMLWEQVEVGHSCMGDMFTKGYEVDGQHVKGFDEMVDDFCATVVSAVVPIPILGPQSKAMAGATKAVTGTTPELAGAGGAVRTPPPKTPVAPSVLAQRTAFVSHFKEAVYISEAQNRKFISLANGAAASASDSARMRFFDIENSVMKKLNDTTGDKELVTSLTNFHKQTVLSRVDALKAKYPGINFEVYSDFKSVKIAIQSEKDIDPVLHQKILQDLNILYQESNAEFVAKMNELGIVVPGAGPAEHWFKAGYGRNVDEASLAARKARQDGGTPRVLDYTGPEVRQVMTEHLQQVEAARRQLSANSSLAPLLENVGPGLQVPRQEVFDLVRKNSSPQALASAMSQRYGRPFSVEDASLLQSYVKGVDEFSPTILVAKRETPTLDGATTGGLTADFQGMGSANLKATAEGIAGKSSLDAAIAGARQGEAAVTRTFQQRMEVFKKVVGGDVVCSGDDCVRTATRAMSEAEKVRVVNALARNPETRAVRMSFVGPGVPPEARMQLASHGESIEKIFRQELEGKIPYDKLRSMTFGLDMKTATLDHGTVNLVVGKSATTRLSASEQAAMRAAFSTAIENYNKGVKAYSVGGAQHLENSLTLVPGAAILGLTAQPSTSER